MAHGKLLSVFIPVINRPQWEEIITISFPTKNGLPSPPLPPHPGVLGLFAALPHLGKMTRVQKQSKTANHNSSLKAPETTGRILSHI